MTNIFGKALAETGASWKNANFGLNLGILFGQMDNGRGGRSRWRR